MARRPYTNVRRRRVGRPRGGNRYRAWRNATRKGRTLANTQRSFYYKQAIDGTMIRGIGARTISQSASAYFKGLEFNADQLPNWSSLSALYDQYCITKVVLKFTPMINVNNVQPLSGTSLVSPGILATVLDYDDPSNPTTLAELQQYQTFKSQPAISFQKHVRVFVPGTKVDVISFGGGSSQANTKKRLWLDCSHGNISHYGCKIYLDAQGNANAPAVYQVEGYMYIKFRNVR